LLLVLAVFATGTAMLLSAVYIRYRDVTQAWAVTLQLLFFASPILYVTSRLPSSLQGVLDLNPIAAIFTQMRHAVLDPSAPTAVEAAGGPLALLVPATIVVGAVVAGLWLFAREAPRMAERL
jgi:ABC-2 type transport system permease protein